MKKYLIFLLFVTLLLPSVTFASWPSSEKLLKTLAPIAGLDEDEVEAVRFSLEYPQCSSTIVSYTVAQDYSLVGFVGTLKTSKLSNLPSLTPLKKSNCKKTNPTQRAYRFIEDQGDALLGKEAASLLKDILSEQIVQGKSELDSQIASIPYVGTILSNWDCACDAAFETDFPAEVLVDKTAGAVIQILENIKKGNIGTAIEILFANFGAETSCTFLSKYTGVDGVPIVSDIAHQSCSSVIGKPLGFVVGAVDDVAQALGIKGYDHVSPDEYYASYMVADIGVANYQKKADSLYNQCYKYFEPSSMSADTAKKVCVLLRQRYMDQSIAKIEWNEAKFARVDYYVDNIKPKATKSVFVQEKDFQKEILNQTNICEAYFKNKYSRALSFQYADKQFCSLKEVEDIMWEARKKAQQNYVSMALPYTEPFCDYRTPNQTALGCSKEGAPLCKQYLSTNACVKSTKYPNGVDVPCCQMDSSAVPKSFIESKKKTEGFAKELDGGIYCKTDNASNPLQISCSLKEAYTTCQNKIGAETLKSCDTAERYKSGVHKYQCCQYAPEKLDAVLGTQTAKNFVDLKNKQIPNSCALGGATEGLSFDPRIVRCANEAQVSQCKNIFYKQCTFNAQGYALSGCCVKDPFVGTNVGIGTTSAPERDPSHAAGAGFFASIGSMFEKVFFNVKEVFTFDLKKAEVTQTSKREVDVENRKNINENSVLEVPARATTSPRIIPSRATSTARETSSSQRSGEENSGRRLPITSTSTQNSREVGTVNVPLRTTETTDRSAGEIAPHARPYFIPETTTNSTQIPTSTERVVPSESTMGSIITEPGTRSMSVSTSSVVEQPPVREAVNQRSR